MSNNETLADIVKEMWLGNTGGLPFAYRIGRPNRTGEHIQIDSVTVADLADRIEAASLRDRVEAATVAVKRAIQKWRCKAGNLATMHEALETSRDFALQIEGKTGEADVADDAGEIIETCEEALKSPPRNCDVYKTKDAARKAFLAEKCHHPCGNCNVSEASDALAHPCGIDWLFAKAEGGAE